MHSKQVIQAIEAAIRNPAMAPYDREVVDVASGALALVFSVLRCTNPCAACGGTGVDETLPWDPRHPVSGQRCAACDGRGFPLEDEDGDGPIFGWAAAYDAERMRTAYPRPRDGRDVKTLRMHLGISQRELAERINRADPSMRASGVTVSRWETGGRMPSPHAVAAMRRVEGAAQRG